MAIWIKWTSTQEHSWNTWLKERPQVIQDMVAQYSLRPDRLYHYQSNPGSEPVRVLIGALAEDGTVTIHYVCDFNLDNEAAQLLGQLWERSVFGINPAELTECEWDGEVMEGASEPLH